MIDRLPRPKCLRIARPSLALRMTSILGLCAAVTAASAASYQGTISNVWAYGTKVYVIVGDGGFDGSSGSCPLAGNKMMFAIDPNTPYGRALLSIALTAKVTGRLAYVGGNSICEGGPGTNAEGLATIDLKG